MVVWTQVTFERFCPRADYSFTSTPKNTTYSPTTRKMKNNFPHLLVVKHWSISKEDQIVVINLALKQLNLYNCYKIRGIESKAGTRLAPFKICETVCNFWHKESCFSTLMSRTAKVRLAHQPNIHLNLNLVNSWYCFLSL